MTEQRSDDDIREIVEQAAEAIGGQIMSDDELAAFMAASDQQSEAKREADKEAGKRFLNEETDQELIETWYADAKTMTLDRLPAFIDNLANGYHHDYGTCCHATAAAAVATLWAMNGVMGHSGFQAGFIGLQVYKKWQGLNAPFRMTDYENLLYPQYEDKFKQISPDTWAWAQEQAAKHLAEANGNASPNVLAHWQKIIDGVVPFGLTVEG